MEAAIDYPKLRKREAYYEKQAKQALKLLRQRTASPTGLAVPTQQIEEALAKFEARIVELTDRAYAVGYELGLKEAIENLAKLGVSMKYVHLPEGIKPPDEDLHAQRAKFSEQIAEAKYLLQTNPGDKLVTLQRVTSATVSVWANEAYTRAYLQSHVEFMKWLNTGQRIMEAKDI